MRFATALLIGSLASSALATNNQNGAEAEAMQGNPCDAAVLAVDAEPRLNINLNVGRQILIPGQIHSNPECPFTCRWTMLHHEFLHGFDRTSGEIVVYTNDETLAGS